MFQNLCRISSRSKEPTKLIVGLLALPFIRSLLSILPLNSYVFDDMYVTTVLDLYQKR